MRQGVPFSATLSTGLSTGFAGALNIEDVEDEIWVIPGRLAFGRRPKRTFLKKRMEERKDQEGAKESNAKKTKGDTPLGARVPQEIKFNTIVNLWRSEWYKDEIPKGNGYFYFPLEDANGCDLTDTVATDDAALLKIAKKIVLLLKGDEPAIIFVHGYGATRYACVITLLAWALFANFSNPIEALHRDVFLNQEHICCDFLPKDDPLTLRFLNLLNKERSGIKRHFGSATVEK